MAEVATLLAAHAALPEARQPVWGLGSGSGAAKRAYDECSETIVPLLLALPREGTLRILDVECAQGYFTLAIAQALAAQGRAAAVVGVDRDADNIEFCEALAAHHGIPARFVRAACDAEFLEGKEYASWDVALVLGALSDAADAEAGKTRATVSLLRKHSRVILGGISERRRPPSSEDHLQAPRAFSRRLATFEAAPGGAARYLYACSDGLAWVGGQWFAFDRVIDRSHPGVPDSFSGQRRFFIGADAVVKVFRADGRHGDFNRAELAAEAAALQALQGEPARYPTVLAQADDGDVVWLARGSLPGELLSERMASGVIDRDAVARGLLGELAHLESRDFYHADLRCWNVLLDGDEVRLIDFGAMVRTPSVLQRLTLCAVLLEIADGQSGHEQPFYASVPAVEAYPPEWQPLLHYLLGVPQSGFRYEEALRILESSFGGVRNRHPTAGEAPELDAELLSSAAQEHCEAFRRLREHDEAMERALAAAEGTHAAELVEVASLSARVHGMEQARRDAEREHVKHASSLEIELEKSRTYATSLETRLDREAADVHTEREAMDAAQRAATSYSDSLKQSLDKSREYVDSLRDSLGQSQVYASSLEQRIARESASAQREREALKRELDAAQAGYARMQRRFRLLKLLWPHEPDDPKESE